MPPSMLQMKQQQRQRWQQQQQQQAVAVAVPVGVAHQQANRTFYHGTSLEAALSIQSTGFDASRPGSNGRNLGTGALPPSRHTSLLKHPCQ